MEIKTKYNIGDKLWYLEGRTHKIKSIIITSIYSLSLPKYIVYTGVYKNIKGKRFTFDFNEDQLGLYPTKEEVERSLKC
jgi:hypothetical protein